ncbi:Serine/threonine-protein kinase pkn3 [Minicystis rosea]|nr:Serine/threonine-protein kinase pkn3 [Minicystis rosea]
MSHGDAPIRPGDILAGKYRVERVLGSGAMGVVVAAMHVELHELRAIKFMLPSMLGDAEGVERFLREARAAVRLKSQHVAKIYDIGRLDTGAPYMVMEYLEGSDLKQQLDTRGPLPIPEAVTYLQQVCEAIAEAHALGIVHRDLKPANLFLTKAVNGAPCIKVLDFGIAKVLGGGDGVDMTQTSALLGTPLYMSPEQMRGARTVDGRSDVWALGAILYRMLAGRTPFSGSSVTEICAAVVADPPDPPSMHRRDMPPALEAAVMRCLEKTPARRFATATELAAAIAPFAVPQAAAPQPNGTNWPSPHAPQAPSSMRVPLAGTAILDASYAVPPAIAAQAGYPAQAAPTAIPQAPMAMPRAPMAAPSTALPQPAIAPNPLITAQPAATSIPAQVAPMAAAAAITAPGHGSAGGMAATQSNGPKKSSAMPIVAGLVGLVVLGGSAGAYVHFAGSKGNASPMPTTTATAEATASASAAPSAAATAEAMTAATATPSATATASATTAPATASATPKPSAPQPKAKRRDAFGNDRK